MESKRLYLSVRERNILLQECRRHVLAQGMSGGGAVLVAELSVDTGVTVSAELVEILDRLVCGGDDPERQHLGCELMGRAM